MKMTVVESTMVKPNISTTMSMWLSNLDLREPMNYHTQILYLYRSSGIDGVFFDSAVLKAALSHALVEFYPMAGRLKMSENNRIEIDCNGEGVLFVEAEAPDIDMDDLFGDDFVPKANVRLIPEVDYSKGISSYPLLLVQMNRFKCGGVCLGTAVEHLVCDGISAVHFINTWSDIARGGGVRVPPFFDRTLLRARDPPRPKFPHIEYNQAPRPQFAQTNNSNLKFSVFKLTRDQLNALKTNYNKLEEDRVDDNDDGSARPTTMPTKYSYSTFEAVAGHLWRCVTQARGLPENQETKMCIATDGRSRLQPPLPPAYFGNAVFIAVAVASCGELIESTRPAVAARKVQEAIKRMDDEYLRSAIDYIELEEDNTNSNGNPYACPNLVISSWGRMPIYDADFGWGKPVYVGLGTAPPEGVVYMWPNDEGLLFAISLPEQQMDVFRKLLYQF